MISEQRSDGEFEVKIEAMLEKVFRIIHEGVILHEYLTDKEYATLAVTLKNINPPLRALRISQCSEKPLTTYALTQLLQGNTTLEIFQLEANKIEKTGIRAIAEMLKQNTRLKQFHCAFLLNGLHTEDVQALSEMLMANTTLKDLTLYAGCIDAEKTKIIATTLAQNPALEILNLASNEIGVEGATALADALTKNTKLLELNITDCRLGHEGRKAIFTALKQNTGLQKLTLRRLDPEVIPTLAEMLVDNKALKKLDLSLYTSELSTEHMQLLLEAIRKNKTLQELDIKDDDGKLKTEVTEIKDLLSKNLSPSAPAADAAAPAAEAPAADAKQEAAKPADKK